MADDETEELQKLTTNLQSVLQRISDMGSIKEDYTKKRDRIMMSPEEFEKLVLKSVPPKIQDVIERAFKMAAEEEQKKQAAMQ